MLPVSALVGAIFLVVADAVARIIIAPEEMPIGIITALCGSPFFIMTKGTTPERCPFYYASPCPAENSR